MKFKTIFIVFNVLFLFSSVFILLMPFFILGGDYVLDFWKQNIILVSILPLIFICFNLFFLSRRRIYSLLEEENWKGLVQHLERRLYRDRRPSSMRIRLLINACFILADMDGIARLDAFLRELRPRWRAKFGLELGLPYLIKDDAAAAKLYFSDLAALPRLRKKGWVLWSLAFSQAGLEETTAAGKILQELVSSSADPVLLSLSLYLLDGLPEMGEEIPMLLARGRDKLRRSYSAEQWEKIIEKGKENLEVLILMKLIKKAAAWLYDGDSSDPEGE